MRDALLQDVRYAIGHLRRSPAFVAAAILTLAFGIGANTAMFTMLNALVIQRLPIPEPDGLIALTTANARGVQRYVPLAVIDELATDGPLQDLCGYNGGFLVAVEANAAPTQALAAFVTGRCFNAFGVRPILGRPIGDADAPLSMAGSRVALISHAFWTRMFGADPGAVGKRIRTEGVELTVIGVLPSGFGGLHVDAGADIFAPFDTIFPSPANRRPVASEMLGRLRPGVSFEQADAQLVTRWPSVLEATTPRTLPSAEAADLFGPIPTLTRLGTGLSAYRTRYARPLTLILGLTGLLLLLACVNLGGLLLTRLTARSTELAVRLALGGSRWRIAQQMLVESLLLSLGGAALAVPLSFAFVTPLASFLPAGSVPRTISFTPDRRVLAVTAAIGFTVGLGMTALPLWFAMRERATLRADWNRTIVGATSRWTRALLVAQVALSVAMLVGAGLLTRSLYLLQRADLGVRAAGVITAKLNQVPNGYRDLEQAAYYPPLLERIAAIPGVRSAGLTRGFPRMMNENSGTLVAFAGDAFGNVRAYLDAVSPGFFETVGIPVVAGRLPSWSDTATARQVAVVSASLARALAPDGDVLDRRIKFGNSPRDQDIVIVGIVGNATQGNPRRADVPLLYRPALQIGRSFTAPNVVVATDRDAADIAAALRAIVRDGKREQTQEVIRLADLLSRAPASERMSATLAGAVGLLAGIIALLGVHGALAYSVSRRTREIGVRAAIGAAPAEIARMVLQEGFTVTLFGLGVGLPLGLATARLFKTLMFGISAADPVTFVAATAFFLLLGLVAGAIPARRAARIDPAIALRAD